MSVLPSVESRFGTLSTPDVPGLPARVESPASPSARSPVTLARAPVPYFSPVLRFDPVGQELIVEFRDSSTGEIENKYPSGWLAQAYQLTGLVEAKGPVAAAREAGVSAAEGAAAAQRLGDAQTEAAISFSI